MVHLVQEESELQAEQLSLQATQAPSFKYFPSMHPTWQTPETSLNPSAQEVQAESLHTWHPMWHFVQIPPLLKLPSLQAVVQTPS